MLRGTARVYKIEVTFGNGTKRIIHKASREAQLRAMRKLERRVRLTTLYQSVKMVT